MSRTGIPSFFTFTTAAALFANVGTIVDAQDDWQFKFKLVEKISKDKPTTICELDSEALINICKKAMAFYTTYKFLDDQPVERARGYKVGIPFLWGTKEKILSACKCPTRPAIYLRNKRLKKIIKVYVEKQPEPKKLPQTKSYRVMRSQSRKFSDENV